MIRPFSKSFRRSSLAALVAVAGVLLGAPEGASALVFGALSIADTREGSMFYAFNSDAYFEPGFSPAPAINNGGQVAFWALTGEGLSEGVFRGAGGAVTAIFETTEPAQLLNQLPSISPSGVVAFSGAGPGNVEGVWTGSGGALTGVITSDNSPYIFFGNPSINADGRIAVFAESDLGVDLVSDELMRVVVASTAGAKFDEFPGSPFYGVPGLIGSGKRVAFYAFTDMGDVGIFESSGVAGAISQTVADTSVDLLDFRDPVMNSSRRVAYWADSDTGGRILFSDDGVMEVVIDAAVDTYGGVAFEELGDPALNDAGEMAFWARLADGRSGVFFLDKDGEISRVLGEGDKLLGSTVLEVGFGNKGLTNGGELAVWALLADDTEVVLRAFVVPEPSTALLLAAGLGALGAAGRRRSA